MYDRIHFVLIHVHAFKAGQIPHKFLVITLSTLTTKNGQTMDRNGAVPAEPWTSPSKYDEGGNGWKSSLSAPQKLIYTPNGCKVLGHGNSRDHVSAVREPSSAIQAVWEGLDNIVCPLEQEESNVPK